MRALDTRGAAQKKVVWGKKCHGKKKKARNTRATRTAQAGDFRGIWCTEAAWGVGGLPPSTFPRTTQGRFYDRVWVLRGRYQSCVSGGMST